jgi:hypothetical protein
MKFSGKPLLFFLVMLMLAAQVNAIEINLNGLQSDIESFADDMFKALPFYSTIGLNWSDAYIGNFPSFGIGLSAGLTTMNKESINKILDKFVIPANDISIFSKLGFPLPNYAIDARIGVPSIPLDFGIKFGYLPPSFLESLLETGIKSMLIGADVRYAIINSKVLPMRVSVGLGFHYLDGGISKEFKTLSLINGYKNEEVKDPKLDIVWNTKIIELKVQASFPYKILTPYAGAGVSYAWSQAGYEISSQNTMNILDNLDKMDVSDDKKSIKFIKKSGIKSGINTRVFGGLSFNLAYVRLDLTGMYEIIYGNFGATFGLRFQM